MPFKSEKQRRWMHSNEPKMAKEWEAKEDNEDDDEVGSTDEDEETFNKAVNILLKQYSTK